MKLKEDNIDNMGINEVIFPLFGIDAVFIIKILAAVFLLFHITFSLVLVQQTRQMNKVIEAGTSFVILSLSITHLLFSVLVFLWLIFIF